MIYYVEDDINIQELTIYALKQAGFEAKGFSNALDFFAKCKKELPELILLDIMLPGIDGIEILNRLRADPATKTIPIMMLTAKGTEFDTVSGLNAGADDYLAKPFGMMELVARVNALLRRVEDTGSYGEDEYCVGSVALSVVKHRVTIHGEQVTLTLKEFDLLKALMRHPGQVLSREQLLSQVWGIDNIAVGETRTVDVHIQTLRQKIAACSPGEEQAIQTIRGVGYRFKESAEKGGS